MMNPGVSRISSVQPDDTPAEYSGSQKVAGMPGVAAMPSRPPTFIRISGAATRKPPSKTTNCKALTHAELNNPPAVKYTVMAMPPMAMPCHRGSPPTTSSTAAPAISCPASKASAPTAISKPTSPRTAPPYLSSRKSPTVKWPRSDANCHSLGPTHNASTSVPMPTAPFHHNAPRPSR